MENLKYTFGLINDWIKTADQKAMILGSFNIAGFIYQLVKFDKVKDGSCLTVTLFAISVASTFVALYFWLQILYPKLDNKLKKSKIFFQHISNAYNNDMASGIEDLLAVTDEEYRKDLASQIVINATIAKTKYANIQKFIIVFAIQIVALGLFFISLI